MRDHYYSSELHRFLSLDKDQGDLYRPSTLNPYAYVGNDPINFIDPSGMVAINFGNAVKDFALASVGAILGFGELALDGTIAAGSIIIGGISIGAILAADIATKVVAGGVVAANMIIGSIIAKSALVATNAADIAKRTWTTGKEIVKKVYEAADNIRRVVDIFSKPKITAIFATEKEFTDYAINKVSEVRNSMSARKLKKEGNVAVAYSDIKGLPNEFVAHSKISRPNDEGGNLYNFSLLQEKRSFTTYMKVGHDRVVDTEAKILEDIYARIKDKNITGTIYLYTELSPCPSCKNIIGEFSQRLPNVTLKVFYGQGNLFFDGNDFLE